MLADGWPAADVLAEDAPAGRAAGAISSMVSSTDGSSVETRAPDDQR